MPDFSIIDTHLHLWDPKRLRYPWIDSIPLLNRPYLLKDYKKACGPVQVEKMVFLQCECVPEQFLQEADWVTSLARQDPRIQGIVPWAPLEKGEAARPDLERLAQNPLIKGVRRIIQFEPDLSFCLRPDFVKGVQILSDYNLSFDICISHVQMANTVRFVRQCPGVRFILDHIGKPDIKDRLLDPWRAEIKTLSEMPNVWCKVSGLVTEADHKNWTREDLKPYIDHVIACFGFDRVVYGGDWPVACQATDYPRWVETLAWAVSGASEVERRKLFHDNAAAFYRL
ncbi:MAG: amidohydrolase [Candidatus Handelsmanbacteria bacterium RIFCSPLOWO2_12_FULL_64_10]|uniref:Amidohydrolase n=1 Tax=Handelsmanbacteria sp. (strain RIFCSPLOWO2_12_FULL_64_10) TaxID=1817868 RepID=A0A1F6CNV6_HANXR|nr:MAG: amidohydrolase [Candidatus Handelsmanbacteria bacterium RIFCSPLOWO2_12_FULL_64_10]